VTILENLLGGLFSWKKKKKKKKKVVREESSTPAE
jgi:hypothetical protein